VTADVIHVVGIQAPEEALRRTCWSHVFIPEYHLVLEPPNLAAREICGTVGVQLESWELVFLGAPTSRR